MPSVAPREAARRLTHAGVGLLALSLRWLPWPVALALAAAGVAMNAFLLRRLAPDLFRPGETAFSGIRAYPMAVLLLLLLFPMRIAAGAWAILAFGDAAAALVGRAWGRAKLPWNPEKSWLGLAAFVAFGTAAGAAAYALVEPRPSPAFGVLGEWRLATAGARASVEPSIAVWPFDAPRAAAILGAAAAAAALAALAESLRARLDDNFRVALVAGVALNALDPLARLLGVPVVLAADEPWVALSANVALGLAALLARAVGLSGLVAGSILGTGLWLLVGWRGWLVLVAFFVIGSALTKVGARTKEARGIAEARGGRRGARNALAKVTPGLIVAALIAWLGDRDGALHAAYVATFATAAADTAGTEIGKAFGRTPILLTTFRRATPGAVGAVSIEGTLAGLAAAAAVAALGGALGLYSPMNAAGAGGAVVAAAFGGNVAESWMNAFFARRAKLDHEVSNFLLCAIGGALGFALARALSSGFPSVP